MKQSLLLSIISTAMILAPLVKANDWDKRTVVTFSQSVEIPGMVLGAGTYVMRLVDLPGDRDVVQFFNKDQTRVYKTVFAIPKYRTVATDKTVITFEERGAGAPQALRTWYYPSDLRGEEFMYPKVRPVVMTAQASASANRVAAVPNPAPQPPPVQAQVQPAPVQAPSVSQPSQPVEVAQAKPAAQPRQATSTAEQPKAKELPKTASELPLIALIGAFSLAGGLCLRRG